MENKEKSSKPKSKLYPAYSINETIEFIDSYKNYPQNGSISYKTAAEQIGVKPDTKSFKYKVSAAKQLGLIITSGSTISFTDIAKNILWPTRINDNYINSIKIEMLKKPALYNNVIDQYDKKQIPPKNIIENLFLQYGILPNVKSQAAEAFLKSLDDAKVNVNGVLTFDDQNQEEDNIIDGESDTKDLQKVYDKNERTTNSKILTIPIPNKDDVKLYIPSNLTKKDVKFIKNMIGLTLDNYIEEDIYSNE